MATSTLSNHFKAQLAAGEIDLDGDTLNVALISGEFTFDKDTHATWGDVSGSELGAGSGYTSGGMALTGVVITEDDSNDRAQLTCDNPQWNATGEMGPAIAAIIWDDTSSDDTVIGAIEFGSDVSVADGSALRIDDIILNLS